MPNFHIYFNNDEKNEIKRNYLTKDDGDIDEIKIIIDKQVNSFQDLFRGCRDIKKIDFIKFKRNNIKNMSRMFYDCVNLQEINFNSFNTENV